MKPLKELTRPNIWALKPYSSARDEYSGKEASIFLDANENPYNTPNNRYPDPLQRELKGLIGRVKKVSPDRIFLGNGSDEAIDLPFRAFCRPGIDNVVAIDPTYGMYQVCAEVNDVEYRKVQLDENFQFKAADLLAAADEHTKLIFLCSPNNPTGNRLCREEILTLLRSFEGLVILDEAYADFSNEASFLQQLDAFGVAVHDDAGAGDIHVVPVALEYAVAIFPAVLSRALAEPIVVFADQFDLLLFAQFAAEHRQQADPADQHSAGPAAPGKAPAQPAHGVHQFGVLLALGVERELDHYLRAVEPAAGEFEYAVKCIHSVDLLF